EATPISWSMASSRWAASATRRSSPAATGTRCTARRAIRISSSSTFRATTPRCVEQTRPRRLTAVRAIDIHAHYIPPAYLAELERAGYPPETVDSSAEPGNAEHPGARVHKLRDRAFVDLDLRIAAMDAQGVSVHALSVPPPYVFARDGALLSRLARAYNDAASEAHRAYPER